VGPGRPQKWDTLPFTYVRSQVKPVQAWAIALDKAHGEFITFWADDVLWDGPLWGPSLAKEFKEIMAGFEVLGVQLINPRTRQSDDLIPFNSQDPKSPLIGYAPIFHTQHVRNLGGLDNRFIATFSDIDLLLRFHEAGYKVVFNSDFCCFEDPSLRGFTTSFWSYGATDRDTLRSLWEKKTDGVYKRNTPVSRFNLNHPDLIQGPRGHWTGETEGLTDVAARKAYEVRRFLRVLRHRGRKLLRRQM
jgi:GT2 family glycosyltransferase